MAYGPWIGLPATLLVEWKRRLGKPALAVLDRHAARAARDDCVSMGSLRLLLFEGRRRNRRCLLGWYLSRWLLAPANVCFDRFPRRCQARSAGAIQGQRRHQPDPEDSWIAMPQARLAMTNGSGHSLVGLMARGLAGEAGGRGLDGQRSRRRPSSCPRSAPLGRRCRGAAPGRWRGLGAGTFLGACRRW